PDTFLCGIRSLALDSKKNLYVGNLGAGSACPTSVTVYPANSSDDAIPSKIIAGSNTGVTFPSGIALDALGKIYVANVDANAVMVYPADRNGDVAPLATIRGPDTDLNLPVNLALDSRENIYVTNEMSTDQPGGNSVTVYPAGSNGDAVPSSSI